MLGLPFLSVKEQIIDTYNTVKWGFLHDCRAVVFPINIKPYTLLYHMNKTGFYNPISYWSIIFLLDMFKPEELSKITIAWYGDRDEGDPFSNDKTLFPMCCDKCYPKLMEFFRCFNSDSSYQRRSNLLASILKESNLCDCYNQFIRNYYCVENNNFEFNYSKYVKKLKEDLNI